MMSRWQYLLPPVAVIAIFFICNLAYMNINGNTYVLPPHKHIVLDYRNHEPTESKPKETILIQLRNRFFKKRTLYEMFTRSSNNPFSKCKINQCKYLPRNTTITPHVLIFHKSDPPDLPAKRLPSQKYIFYTGENEYNIYRWSVQYNLTMTHRQDSDIPMPNFSIEKKEDMLENNFNFAAGKSKKIAWVVSHCQTRSEREIYVKELRKYIDIDIYGKCGDLSCERETSCWQRINTTYKFYLSFENAFCKDYYTEKIKRPLAMGGIIPVVMGGSNYSKFLPPHSYIDVMDFPSPRALAVYLHKLDNNDMLYNEYFGWLGHYDIVSKDVHCTLCAYLHTNRDAIKVYDNIKTWFDPATRCRPGNWSHYDWS